jgi:hypothetical protein
MEALSKLQPDQTITTTDIPVIIAQKRKKKKTKILLIPVDN